MFNSHLELKKITDNIYAKDKIFFFKNDAHKVISILEKNYIKLRESKNNILCQVNISYPLSRKDTILVGLRYIKTDNSNAEDHFLFEIDNHVTPFYKGKLEKLFPEYIGTHKAQI